MSDFNTYVLIGVLVVISWELSNIGRHLKEIAKNTKKY